MIEEVLFDTAEIILLTTLFMVVVEWIQINYKERILKYLTDKKSNQVVGSSLVGIIPGCAGAFFVVSLYSHGIVGFGALSAVMLATAGEEAYVILATLPIQTSLLLFSACFIFGIVGGFAAEKLAKAIGMKPKTCPIDIHPAEEHHGGHFLTEHVYHHIIKKHVPTLFFWVFLTLLAFSLLTENFDLEAMLPENMFLMLALAALVGIIPESGPHLIFVTLFAQGLIPFSVLLTSTLVQDGHGLLPLLSWSVEDTVKVKVFNLAFGLLIGALLLAVGF